MIINYRLSSIVLIEVLIWLALSVLTLIHADLRKVCHLAFVTFGLAVFEQQLLWDNENKVSSACNKVKCLISILSVFMAAVIICRKELVLHEQKHCGLVIKDASLWNCHLSRDLLFEVIFNLLCSPPYVAPCRRVICDSDEGHYTGV